MPIVPSRLLPKICLRSEEPACCFANVHSACGYEFRRTANRVNDCGTDITQPGCAEARLAATKPSRLQLECQGDNLTKDKVTIYEYSATK